MSKMRHGALGVALAAVAAVAAGCGGDDEEQGATAPQNATEQRTEREPADARVELDEYSFDPSKVEVERGSAVLAENVGSIAHNLTIERGTSPREPSEELAGTRTFSGGESEELEVRVPPGRYSMVCTVPGHREAGMVGTITVK
jgi:plastocyanin